MATKVWANITDLLWPVGSVYRCLHDTDNYPTKMFGGSWKVIGQETFSNETFDLWYRYA